MLANPHFHFLAYIKIIKFLILTGENMAKNGFNNQVGGGLGSPIKIYANRAIVAHRAPTSDDQYPIGQLWCNVDTDTSYILVSPGTWTTSPGTSGSITATDITVNPGNVTVSAGDVDITLGSLTVGANATVSGNLDVVGNVTVGGDFDIASAAALSFTTTSNTDPAISFTTNGGTSETIILTNTQGTAADAIDLVSTAGGIRAHAGGAAMTLETVNQAMSLVTGTGQINIGADLVDKIIQIGNAVGATEIAIDSGTAGTISTSTGVITQNSAGLLTLQSTRDNAQAILINATVGGIDITAAGASAGEDIDISALGSSVNITSTENVAQAIYLRENAGTSGTIQIHADQGTGVASINLLSDVGGITLTATGLASADAINLEAPVGGVDVDAALQINIASSQAAADALRLVASNAAGGVDIDSGTGGITIDTTGALSLDSAAASNFTVTGAFDLTLASSAGSVNITAGEAAADAILIDATNAAGGIDINSGTGGILIATTGAGDIALTAGATSNGTITLTSTGTGDIVLDSDDTMLLDADGVLELNSSAGVISIGNDAVGQNINIGTAGSRDITIGNATAGTDVIIATPANTGLTFSTSLVRMMAGSGSPDTVVTAPAGSLFLRTDPAGATSRLYINTDGATAWTNITCAS